MTDDLPPLILPDGSPAPAVPPSPVPSSKFPAHDSDASLRAQLDGPPEADASLRAALGEFRTFSATTFWQLTRTGNEWLAQVPRAEMKDAAFATLAFLFVHCAPVQIVRRVVWDSEAFFEAVQAWADRRDGNGDAIVRPEHLALADELLEVILQQTAASDFRVAERPGSVHDPTAPEKSSSH